MKENMTLKEYLKSCKCCGGKLNDWYIGNTKGAYFNKKLQSLRQGVFCTEECYEDYKKDFAVEIYNDKPIYCVEINGEKRYLPYFEAKYYFKSIDDCKKRMDDRVAIMTPSQLEMLFDRD